MNPEPWLEIRPIPDDPETLRPLVTEGEWDTAASMSPAARRNEWLAWRAIARERLGPEITITYDPNDAPVLENGKGCLGISHTRGWVAAAWSPERCAVDIEHSSRDVSRTCARFVAEQEKHLADATNPLFPISVWCAKETLYKYAGQPGLDFLRDIRITASDISAGKMEGSIKGDVPIEIRLLFHHGLAIAVI